MTTAAKLSKVLAVGLGAAMLANTAAFAGNVGNNGISSISMDVEDGIHAIEVRNFSLNKNLSALNLKPVASSIEFDVSGSVSCDNGYYVNGAAFGIGSMTATWEKDAPFSVDKNKKSRSFATNLNVPLSQIKNGGNGVSLDPAAIVLAAANQHAANGGSKIDYLRQDHSYNATLYVRFGGGCSYVGDPDIQEAGGDGVFWGAAWEGRDIMINYKGDPKLMELKAGNAMAGNGKIQKPEDGPSLNPNIELGGEGGFQAGYNPVKFNTGKLSAAGPRDHVGHCGVEKSFRATLNGQGKGKVLLRVYDLNNEMVYWSQNLPYNGGQLIHDFGYMMELANGKQVGDKHQHAFVLKLNYQTEGSDDWSGWKKYDQFNWSHTCTPKVKPGIMGGAGNKVAPQANTPKPNGLGKAVLAPKDPAPKPRVPAATRVAPKPVDPTPPSGLTPTRIAPQTAEPQPSRAVTR